MFVASSLRADNFFKLEPLEYFQFNKKKQPKEQERILDWPQSTPQVVINLLNDPNPSNAQAYLNWQEQKMQHLIKAQQAVDKIIKEER